MGPLCVDGGSGHREYANERISMFCSTATKFADTLLPRFIHGCLALCLFFTAITANALSLTGVQSRKTHALATGEFPLNIDTNPPSGKASIESRAIGASHRIVFLFDGPVATPGTLTVIDEVFANVPGATAAVSATLNNEVVVTFPTLGNNKRLLISLNNVDGVGLNVSATVGFQIGDVNQSGSVTAQDVSSVKARAGQSAANTTFHFDLNTSGLITAADIAAVKSRTSGSILPPFNLPPTANAGANQIITIPAIANLAATASDDGLPNPPGALALSWTRFSGPATMAFGNATATNTTASFTTAGVYVLRFTANDSHRSASSDVTITVNPGAATTLTVSGITSPRIAGSAGTVTVTARDAGGNVATGYVGTVHFTSDAGAVLPADYTFTGGDAGVRTFPVTLNTVGTRSVTATDTVSAGITGSQTGITVNSAVLPGLFEKLHGWNKDVSALPVSSRSAAIISTLQNVYGGWGNGNKLQIDFSIAILDADSMTPRRNVFGAPNYYLPDSESVPFLMPAPVNGYAEGNPGYACNTAGEDCHILVVERSEKKLYELYNATTSGANFIALGGFVWDLTKQYGPELRGEQCTSADAAGLPIAALTPTADEVAAGEVPHALRFILPNSYMKASVYVHPATHAGGPSSGLPDAPPYGVRLRLKSTFNETPYSTGAKVILRAMKKYGMILSDGGNIALTFADDRLSTAKWLDANVNIVAQTFNTIGVSNFDVVDLEPEIALTYDCVRAP